MPEKSKSSKKDISEYNRKRDFSKTPEPKGTIDQKVGRQFVIQKHDATRLHFDLRLELDGVLKSWALPKGPSLDTSDKRFAVHVEDHPIEYGSFEGTIPKAEYGGGTVMLWDVGTYTCDTDPYKEYADGSMKVTFAGKRMKGKWALIKIKKKGEEDQDNWLFIKERTDRTLKPGGTDITEEFLTSVTTGRTMTEIAEGKPSKIQPTLTPHQLVEQTGAKRADQPPFIKPQLASLVNYIPLTDEWLHEIKFDGYRIQAVVKDGKVKLLSRNQQDYSDKFSSIVEQILQLGITDGILDGEVAVLDRHGITDFSALQSYVKKGKSANLVYFAFDLLHFDRFDLRTLPLLQRKEILKSLVKDSDIRYSDHIIGSGQAFLQQVSQSGLEGVISKRVNGKYESSRSQSWVKIKCKKSQEFVIGGYTHPKGDRSGFGALALGYYQDGDLIYCGRVGTGFDDQQLKDIRQALQKLESKENPFDDPPTGEDAKGLQFVKPELIAEVEFGSWTNDNRIRHATFKGLRTDKRPEEIKKDIPLARIAAKPTVKKDHLAGIKLSHPGKLVYKEPPFTKQQLAEYYSMVADDMLLHIGDRPLSLLRCPDNIGECFFQKNYNDHYKSSVFPVKIDKDTTGITIQDEVGLISLIQYGVVEIHPWGSRNESIELPDRLTFDLDPGPELSAEYVSKGARDIRELLLNFGLESWVKTSGGKGLHVCVPILPELEWDTVKAFCQAVANILSHQYPKRYLAEMSKAKRKGKIFVDYLRNGRGATSVAIFSTRAREGGAVSCPITWSESAKLERFDSFTVFNMEERLNSLEIDPWEGFLDCEQSLKSVLDKIDFD